MSEPNQTSIAPTQHPPSFRGVEHAGVIDALEYDPESGEVVLIMVDSRPWDGSEKRLFQLQEKFNAYVSFALDGEMNEAYPALMDKPLRIVLKCATAPDSMTRHLLGLIRDQIAFQGIKLEVRAAADRGGEGGGEGNASNCGTGCGCAGPGASEQ